MSFFTTMVQLQLELFLLMVIGFICRRIGMINDSAKKSMSDLLIYVILPCNILHSFTSGVKVCSELIFNCILAVVISIVIQFAAIYGSRFIFKKQPIEKRNVASYGIIVSNSSFIGIPVADSVYGDIGVLYTSVFQIPMRFTMWTAGLALFTDINKKAAFKKVITHPCIIACVAGFIMMIAGFSFNGFVEDTVVALSKCTGPVSMIVIGSILYSTDKKQLFKKDVIIFCFWRLILFPLIVFIILKLLNVNETILGISVILTAMPAGSTTAILPEMYHCDSEYGAALIFTSTLLSIVTIPFLSLLL